MSANQKNKTTKGGRVALSGKRLGGDDDIIGSEDAKTAATVDDVVAIEQSEASPVASRKRTIDDSLGNDGGGADDPSSQLESIDETKELSLGDGGTHSRKRRAAAGRTFKEFLTELTRFVNVGRQVTDLSALTKSVKSGVRSFDDIIGNLPISKAKNGVISIADTTVGAVRRVSREGNLAGLAKLSKTPVQIAEAEKRAFSRLVADTPEKSLYQLSESVSKVKQARPNLDATVENIDKLSTSSKAELKKVENTLLKKFKQGTVIALTIGAVYVGVDWISKATAARKGCFMLTTINGKTVSCKVAAFSCSSPSGGTPCTGKMDYYNVTLMIIAYAQLPDTNARKVSLCTALDVKPEEMAKSIKTIIDTKFEKANEFLQKPANRENIAGASICTLKSNDVENGKIPDCRMCSPSDNPTSTTFIDPAQFPDNVTFQCVVNPSILDTITDTVASTATDLWGSVSSGLGSSFKKIGIAAAAIVVLLLVVWLVVRYVFSGKGGGGGGYALMKNPTQRLALFS